ncbi:MAG: NDP-sugar synthase [Planctomycetota bacterium]
MKRDRDGSSRAHVGGVVLAGTHPWGWDALDNIVPRPLLPVANRPLISYVLEWLSDDRIRNITICGNSDTNQMRRMLSLDPSIDWDVEYYEDSMPRGPAGCVRDAIASAQLDPLVIADGTILPRILLSELLEAHASSKAVATVVVNQDLSLRTRRADQLTPMGIYVFSREALQHIPAIGYQDIKEALIPLLFAKGLHVESFIAKAQAPRITGSDSYMAVHDWAIERSMSDGFRKPGYRRIGDACIHESSVVHPTARFVGSVLIGPDTTIGKDVIIVGPTGIGSHCSIGNSAVICRSAVWNDCAISAGCVVDRSVLTYGARVSGAQKMRNIIGVRESPPSRLLPQTLTRWPARRREQRASLRRRTRQEQVAAGARG